VSRVVSKRETAELLQRWYRGWCKRPCFHDDYLAAFNKPNVKLADLRNTEISGFTGKGIIVGKEAEYPLDLIVLGTGLTFSGAASPACKAEIAILGRGGKSMQENWATGLATLHGVVSGEFPNLFYPGPHQIGVCANQMYVLDQLSSHVAYTISTAKRRATAGTEVTIEPMAEAEECWAGKITARAGKTTTSAENELFEITPRNHARLSPNYAHFLVTTLAVDRDPFRRNSSRNATAVVEVAGISHFGRDFRNNTGLHTERPCRREDLISSLRGE
jgi:cation diffusion facilitator CzcD-associated flavoprotein CzcO